MDEKPGDDTADHCDQNPSGKADLLHEQFM